MGNRWGNSGWLYLGGGFKITLDGNCSHEVKRCFLLGRKVMTNLSQSVSSVTQSCPTLWPHELQHVRPPCPSPTPGVHSNSCPLSPWCYPAISSSVIAFSSCPQPLPTSESFPMSQLFTWGSQSTGVSALALLDSILKSRDITLPTKFHLVNAMVFFQ